ncbi:FGGY-family carbohydrate kinase [Sphingobacterium sp.]|uniref:FGGY-family carbohydrate kinase n=1 Tax=Sphingobacterium sp. TaxID=341027 RepID=UPI002FDDAEC2
MDNKSIPVVAVFDVGKTNKKLLLFDQSYRVVWERSARFLETVDEDGDPCENLESLRLSIFDALHEVLRKEEFDIRAINFASYGASLVYIDVQGKPLTPLYSYLKSFPVAIQQHLYDAYGGVAAFSLATASPPLGSLNSGLQLLRMKYKKPDLFKELAFAVHLPQYLSFLVSGKLCTDLTSIGCHTALWDFKRNHYHQWVEDEGLMEAFPPIVSGDTAFKSTFLGKSYWVGPGLHDSSAALIPYLMSNREPFILISTGTWCISLNPFAATDLTMAELQQDCLFYLSFRGTSVKASRLFAGHEHEIQSKRIADFFQVTTAKFKNLEVDWDIVADLMEQSPATDTNLSSFNAVDLNNYSNYKIAYHSLIWSLVKVQVAATQLVLRGTRISRIFIDGGFSRNQIYMNLIAREFSAMKVFAAAMPQATALGAALLMHQHWNAIEIPQNLVELKLFKPHAIS